jgi:glycosyltransferase involved in cell wall biosynthesis
MKSLSMQVRTLVSIIIPSYNQGQYLEESILSVLNQTYEPVELIIIDGCSTDKSIEIIKNYESKITYWISESDKGQAEAINKGFSKASGDLICWVNSDDILYPEFIKRRVDEFIHFPDVAMIYGDVDQGWDIKTKVLRKGAQQNWKEMITSCIVKVPQMSAIWKKEVYESLGGLDTSLNVLLDWEYFVRIATIFKILYMPGSVAFFRQHNLSKSNNLNSEWAIEMMRYYDKNIFTISDNKILDYKKVQQNLYFICSEIYDESQNHVESRRYLKKAKGVALMRFYRIFIFKQVIQFLVRIKNISYEP